jgi:hypothetical protein
VVALSVQQNLIQYHQGSSATRKVDVVFCTWGEYVHQFTANVVLTDG